jgi:hypothetical protein
LHLLSCYLPQSRGVAEKISLCVSAPLCGEN